MRMSMRTAIRSSLSALFFCFALGCSDQDASPEAAAGEPVVYTTFYPTAYFTERIAGDRLKIVCPVPEGEDPIFWNP